MRGDKMTSTLLLALLSFLTTITYIVTLVMMRIDVIDTQKVKSIAKANILWSLIFAMLAVIDIILKAPTGVSWWNIIHLVTLFVGFVVSKNVHDNPSTQNIDVSIGIFSTIFFAGMVMLIFDMPNKVLQEKEIIV